ncbi:MAG: mechanosensitive ion channel [Bacteroidales bacterium]|jgi:miniconductance mechanosensitive channel|nr:mechanosensitive ion channel [Bacteroidales bacterium]
MKFIEHWLEILLIRWGVSEVAVIYLRLLILLVAVGILALIVFWIMKHIVIKGIYKVFLKTSFRWDDALVKFQVFNNVAHLVPAFIVRGFLQLIFVDFADILPLVIKITDSYLVIVFVTIINSFLRVSEYGLSKTNAFKDKPIASYFQLIKIILYIATGVLILSIILGKSPVVFLGAFGAMTAILLLIFKDTILGLVASVQMATSDTVRVGDWIEMPKFNADGEVVMINLNTVKIQNWDKTITSVPTHHFMTESFKNWRAMQESGGRRIKRSVYINVHTVKFIDQQTRERYKKIHYLTEYIMERQEEIDLYNIQNQVDTTEVINGRRMTNLGVFRKYIENYITNRPDIRKDMTLMVRQMPIEDRGVPIEIYCFTNTTKWTEYEDILANIFDHILAAATYFELDIYQQPSGKDISRPLEKVSTFLQIQK